MRTLLFAILLAAQTPARVEFEVVSIKPGDPTDGSSSAQTTPGGLRMRNATLRTLLMSAYRLNELQLEGGPKWMDSARFHIDAKFPAGAPHEQIPQMFQAMLDDRFQLRCHKETRTISEYALVVAKGGPHLEAPREGDSRAGGASQSPRKIEGHAQPVATLARMLISVVGAPVIDRTGLEGSYTFSLAFAPLEGATDADIKLPTIFTAVQQLGLKLEPVKGPIEIVVVDSAELPTAN